MSLEYVPYEGEVSIEEVELPHPFYAKRGQQDGELPRTLVELEMCALSASVRAEPEWWRKLTDPDTRARWMENGFRYDNLTRTHIDYVMDELAGYSALRDEETGIEVARCDKIWQSDALIPDLLRDALREGVKVLQDVADDQNNWQPGASGLVLDLVHPSLYPLVYGRTLVHQPQGLKVAEAPEGSSVTSQRFAWLPTNFLVGASGVKALGYINNVHPSNTTLLTALECIVGAFVPLFERVLTDLLPENSIPLRVRDEYEWTEMDEQYSDESDNEYERRYDVWFYNYRHVIIPDAPAYPGGIDKRAKVYTLKGREIQVIVKLTTIILTPEKPEYPGGPWHVEGTNNERIVASGIYYYDDENIGKSHRAFRTAVSAPNDYTQNDDCDDGAEVVWGLETGGLLVQDLGSLDTKCGRCIAFPNIFQHRVAPFSLLDKTKPGHRKILALFLVD
ncbi:hypothetical protein EXIGLDRAFT_832794 [Exidia glandulosa HHB12029]|uniref:Uncharacterized protein n=1 Tax=Exidia glandulosa HHB12029 TaxID=1314781 RepID=A0A165L907_EXIGL|nr:hypothetical protein EXIGLDRAFT_832794 [Exidia glandulosa HHB12029]